MCRDYVMMIYRDTGDTGEYFLEICEDFLHTITREGAQWDCCSNGIKMQDNIKLNIIHT